MRINKLTDIGEILRAIEGQYRGKIVDFSECNRERNDGSKAEKDPRSNHVRRTAGQHLVRLRGRYHLLPYIRLSFMGIYKALAIG
jgi:hypothetical protein